MIRKIPNPIAFVKRGYDQIAAAYHAQRNLLDNRDLLEEFLRLLVPRGCVLDVGCGAGVPVTRFLVEAKCTVTSIDISRRMLALARMNVPDAQLLEMNMMHLAFQTESFDGLTAFYTIFHVPRVSHRQVFAEFARVLKPGGSDADWPRVVRLGRDGRVSRHRNVLESLFSGDECSVGGASGIYAAAG